MARSVFLSKIRFPGVLLKNENKIAISKETDALQSNRISDNRAQAFEIKLEHSV